MNERGFVSIVAMFIMLILTMAIAGMNSLAARQADITRNFKTETKLQNAAESVFNKVAVELINDPELEKNYGGYTKNGWSTEKELLTRNFGKYGPIEAYNEEIINSGNDTIKVSIYLRKFRKKIDSLSTTDKTTYEFMIVIMTLAEIENYNFNYSVYRKAYGYLGRKVIFNKMTGEIDKENSEKEYQFREYVK